VINGPANRDLAPAEKTQEQARSLKNEARLYRRMTIETHPADVYNVHLRSEEPDQKWASGLERRGRRCASSSAQSTACSTTT
jgi:hypothetical protein